MLTKSDASMAFEQDLVLANVDIAARNGARLAIQHLQVKITMLVCRLMPCVCATVAMNCAWLAAQRPWQASQHDDYSHSFVSNLPQRGIVFVVGHLMVAVSRILLYSATLLLKLVPAWPFSNTNWSSLF